ncbi:hypothetical protein [Psychrobacter sp.]|uniref:hypothetical protein n=1 Tax=Psychrobacter sp. TaxID=56811 RepID=UPI0028AC1A08|nr:hypothetical protein [Psychrobacter sp.]
MSDETEVKQLLNAVSMLIEHDTALIAQREEQDKETAKLVNDLTAQLKDYQQRENEIKNAIAMGTANETSTAVAAVLNRYHERLTEGVGGHVERANTALVKTVNVATTNINDLTELSGAMTKTFDANFKSLSFFSTEFEQQNKRLAKHATDTLTTVREKAQKGAEQYTQELSSKFAEALSWKIAGILGAICLFILLTTLFLGWLLIPSKAEIAERQSEYNKLAAAKVAHNVVRGQDGYYARIKPKSCFIGSDKYQYCKFR